MNTTNKRQIIIAVCTLLLVALRPAAAQTSADQEVVTLSPFLVKTGGDEGYSSQQTLAGSRSAKDLGDIPSAVSIINKALIDDLNAIDVHATLQFATPGVGMNNVDYDDVNIRGFRVSNSFRNGVIITDYDSMPLFDVARIEVIKGPDAMLLGNNSYIGGALNYVTIEPTSVPAGSVALTVADDGEHPNERMVVNTSGPAYKSADLTALYRLSFAATDGDRDRPFEKYAQKFNGGGLNLYLGKDTNIKVNWFVMQDNGYYYYDDFLDIHSTFYAVLNRYSTRSFFPVAATVSTAPWWRGSEEQFDITMLTKISQNGSLRLFYAYNGSTSKRLIIRDLAVAADDVTVTRQVIPYDQTFYTDDIQLDYLHRLGLKFFTNDFSAGFDYQIASSFVQTGTVNLPSINVSNPNFSGDNAAIAAAVLQPDTSWSRTLNYTFSDYLQDYITTWKDRLIVVGGMRWFNSVQYAHNYVANTFVETDNPTLQTYKFGAVLKPLPWLSVYYSNAENVIAQSGFTTQDPPQPLQNQRGLDAEEGLKVERRISDKVSVTSSMAYFTEYLTNVKTNTSIINKEGQVTTIQESKNSSKGFEFGGDLRIKFDSGTADLLVNYYTAVVLDAQTGLKIVNGAIPRSYSVLAKYAFTGTLAKGLSIGGGLYNQGQVYQTGYYCVYPTLFNLLAHYSIDSHWGVQANWNNVQNRTYVATVAATGLAERGDPGNVSTELTYAW